MFCLTRDPSITEVYIWLREEDRGALVEKLVLVLHLITEDKDRSQHKFL